MKTQRNFKCKECGIFSVAYDTRDRRLFKIFPCKCGKVEVSARGVDSFAIFKGDNFVEDLLQEEINPTVEYYPEDYLTLPGERGNLGHDGKSGRTREQNQRYQQTRRIL